VASQGESVGAVLASLDQRFAGIRFRIIDEQDRIRPHIRIFVNHEEVNQLSAPVGEQDEIHLICALSGG
jgi:sulfur-carrier protein